MERGGRRTGDGGWRGRGGGRAAGGGWREVGGGGRGGGGRRAGGGGWGASTSRSPSGTQSIKGIVKTSPPMSKPRVLPRFPITVRREQSPAKIGSLGPVWNRDPGSGGKSLQRKSGFRVEGENFTDCPRKPRKSPRSSPAKGRESPVVPSSDSLGKQAFLEKLPE